MPWIKVLLAIYIVPGPSLSTVLTDAESAMSPTDSYSPLLSLKPTATRCNKSSYFLIEFAYDEGKRAGYIKIAEMATKLSESGRVLLNRV